MIPGQDHEYTPEDFRKGINCGVVGCPRQARHQWAYPCALNTDQVDPGKAAWIPVCDGCDLELNRRLLEVVGVPFHVLEPLLERYKAIQGDMAYDGVEREEDDSMEDGSNILTADQKRTEQEHTDANP